MSANPLLVLPDVAQTELKQTPAEATERVMDLPTELSHLQQAHYYYMKLLS